MLPSSGYFRSAVCPFFKSGFCERPHCHFKHVKPDHTDTVKTCWTLDGIDDLDVDKKPNIAGFSDPEVPQSIQESSSPPTYNPTPVSKCANTHGILKASSIKQENPSFTAPEYKPTPIAQLQQQYIDIPVITVPDVTYLETLVRHKKKRVVEEYVPEVVRCPATRKRVSFNLPEESVKEEIPNLDPEIFTVDSSDDDDVKPTFSDDDGDDDVIPLDIKVEPKTEIVLTDVEDEVIPVQEFSLVDQILVDVSKNDKYFQSFKHPPKAAVTSNTKKSETLVFKETSVASHKSEPPAKKNQVAQAGGSNKLIKTEGGVTNKVIKTEGGVTNKVIKTEHEVTDKLIKTEDEVTDKLIKKEDGITDKPILKREDGVTNKLIKMKDGVTDKFIKTEDGVTYKLIKTEDRPTKELIITEDRLSEKLIKTEDVVINPTKKVKTTHDESTNKLSKKSTTDSSSTKRKEACKEPLTEKSSKSHDSRSIHDKESKSSKKQSSDHSSSVNKKTEVKTTHTSTKRHDSKSVAIAKDKTNHHESLHKSTTDSKVKSKPSSDSQERKNSKSENKSKDSNHSSSSHSSHTSKRDSKSEAKSKDSNHNDSSHSSSASKTHLKTEKKSDKGGGDKTECKSSHSSDSKYRETKDQKKGDNDKSKPHSSRSESKDKITTSHPKSKDKHEHSKTEKSDKHSTSKRSSESSNSHPKKLKTSHGDSELSAKKDSTKIQDEKITSSVLITKKSKSSDSKSSRDRSEIKSNSRPSQSKIDSSEKHKPSKTIKIHESEREISTSKHSNSARSPQSISDSNSSPEKDVSGSGDVVFSSSDSENDVDEECWRIFNESEDTSPDHSQENSNHLTEVTHSNSQDESLLNYKKKRLAHQESFERPGKSVERPPAKRFNPIQVMHNRYLNLQEKYGTQTEKVTNSLTSSSNKKPNVQRKRIVGVPNPHLANAILQKNKYPLLNSSNHVTNPSSDNPTSRVSETLKSNKRVAHIPIVATKPRPIIPSGISSKVPSNIRQKYLNNFIDECLKFCMTEDEAYTMALDEESVAYDRCSSRTVYFNVAANALNRLRHRAREGPILDSSESYTSAVSSTTNPSDPSRKTVSHEAVLAGARAQRLSYSIEKRKFKPPEILFKGIVLYEALQKYIMTEDQLRDHGFPILHPSDPGRAVISGIYSHKHSAVPSNDPSKRICSRCQKTYYVNEEGDYIKEEECDFHWGKLYKRRIAGQFEARYTCCSSDAESDGCCVGLGHVFDGFDSHLLKGFVKTMSKTPPADNYYGVYSLDCEMCYTTAGIELTRVTVISPDMKPIFETYVKPDHRVLDYNTRFSGIKEEDLVGETRSIRDVQAVMMLLFNDKTILIGHSLESDLKALKLVHKTVVDTSIVFPHKLGLPYKRGLRTLMAEKCNKIIQNSTEGHDSQEDAVACMELMMWKLKEDAKCPK